MRSGDLVDGRYEILCDVASGGMASVYAARVVGAEGFEKLVALKRMLPKVSGNEDYRRMFLDEAKVAAHIHSPYVVSTFDLGEQPDGSLYIVMDLVVGTALSGVLGGSAGRLLPVPVVATIIEQSARGLHDAHTATNHLGEPLGIVHRDISPQNVLVGLDGATRITDFGVAFAVERLTKTVGLRVKGKLAYCSPEQARAEPLDHRSDIFALGIVLWESLTLQRLFRGHSPVETVKALLSDPIPNPRTLRPDIPEALAAVAMRALERDPAQRFATALQMAEAIRATGLSARATEVRALIEAVAGPSIHALTSNIRAAVANSPIRATPKTPNVTVASSTIATKTMLSLEAFTVATMNDRPSGAADTRQERAPFAAIDPRQAPTALERPVAGIPLGAATPQQAPTALERPVAGTPLGAAAQQTAAPQPAATTPKRSRRIPLIAVSVIAGILVGGVGVYAAISATSSPPSPAEFNAYDPATVAAYEAEIDHGVALRVSAIEAQVAAVAAEEAQQAALQAESQNAAASQLPIEPDKPTEALPPAPEAAPPATMRRSRSGRRLCTDTCAFADDGDCDDGGENSTHRACRFGSDCTDCGPRRSVTCNDACHFAGNRLCDDGGPNSQSARCTFGTDCTECGRR